MTLYFEASNMNINNQLFQLPLTVSSRQTYLEMRFREYDLDKFGILKRSQEIQDKEGKRIDLIKTVRSKKWKI